MELLSCPLIESIVSTGTKKLLLSNEYKRWLSWVLTTGQETLLKEKGNSSILKAPFKYPELPVVGSDHRGLQRVLAWTARGI